MFLGRASSPLNGVHDNVVLHVEMSIELSKSAISWSLIHIFVELSDTSLSIEQHILDCGWARNPNDQESADETLKKALIDLALCLPGSSAHKKPLPSSGYAVKCWIAWFVQCRYMFCVFLWRGEGDYYESLSFRILGLSMLRRKTSLLTVSPWRFHFFPALLRSTILSLQLSSVSRANVRYSIWFFPIHCSGRTR